MPERQCKQKEYQFDRSVEPANAKSKQVLEDYTRQARDCTWWKDQFQTTLPYSRDFVWQVILEPRNFPSWVRSSYAEEMSTPLPQRFGLGSSYETYVLTNGKREGTKDTVTIVDGCFEPQPDRSLSVVMSFGGLTNGYFEATVKPFERYSSKVTLAFRWYREKPKTFLEKTLFKPGRPIEGDPYNVGVLKEKAKRLSNVCYEVDQFGEILPNVWPSDQPMRYWLIWTYTEGVLRYYPDRNGKAPKVGQRVSKGERLGYVTDASRGEEYSKESLYTEIPIDGYIAHLKLNDGDRVAKWDKIFLICESLEEVRRLNPSISIRG